MWHILKKYNRVVAKKVTEKEAQYLQQTHSGECKTEHTPRYYFLGEPIPYETIIGYTSNEKAIYNYPQIEVIADGNVVCCVTDKKDAFRIMNALKRDYKDVIVRLK